MPVDFTYMKTPLRRYTFENRRIREWVEEQCEGYVLNLFAGKTLLDCPEWRNDIREEMVADSHMDAFDFVRFWKNKNNNPNSIFDTIILDPPYSYRKSMEMYDGATASRFTHMLNKLPDIMTPNGIVITFGYQSVVMGKGRGFKQEHILLISPGGAIHDVIATKERRIT